MPAPKDPIKYEIWKRKCKLSAQKAAKAGLMNYWKGKTFSKEHLKKLSIARQGRKPNLGNRLSEEDKALMSIRYKKRWANPEFKQRMRIIRKQMHLKNPGEMKRIAQFVPKGSKSPQWRGEQVQYAGIHTWLRKYYGNANHCENITCFKRSTKFEWAKIKGKDYKRRRNHFMQLCRSCHKIYDDIGRRNLWHNKK